MAQANCSTVMAPPESKSPVRVIAPTVTSAARCGHSPVVRCGRAFCHVELPAPGPAGHGFSKLESGQGEADGSAAITSLSG